MIIDIWLFFTKSLKIDIIFTMSKVRSKCLLCSKETARVGYTYCSNLCQRGYEYQEYIKNWKNGKESGLRNTGVVCNHVKKYLRRKYNDRCSLCKWSKVNIKTGLVPLVADHIDGDWRNNREENLRLICPNCDALSPTFAALNKGSGREGRVISKRAREARFLVNKMPM